MSSGDVIHDLIAEARAILDEPGHWIKGRNSEDAYGLEVAPSEAAACCWCLQGAVMLACRRKGVGIYGGIYDYALGVLADAAKPRVTAEMTERASSWTPLIVFNDDAATRHEDILALLDDAIAHRRAA